MEVETTMRMLGLAFPVPPTHAFTQDLLDQLVRRNEVDTSSIAVTERTHLVTQGPSERALYLAAELRRRLNYSKFDRKNE